MIKINKTRCIGCASCALICPKVFKIGKDAKAEVISEERLSCVEESIDLCPVGAIINKE